MARSHVILPAETENLARQIVDSAVKVHATLGPGLLESVYEKCLAIELTRRNITFKQQVAVPIVYEGTQVDPGLRLDLVAGGQVVVEMKAVEKLLPVHEAQLLTYLKLTGLPLGLLLNFNVPLMKDGIRRLIR